MLCVTIRGEFLEFLTIIFGGQVALTVQISVCVCVCVCTPACVCVCVCVVVVVVAVVVGGGSFYTLPDDRCREILICETIVYLIL